MKTPKTLLPEQFVLGSDLADGPTHLEILATRLGIQTEHGRIALKYALNQVILLDKKQQDYGPRNISDFGLPGVVIRMNDKMQRLVNLGKTKRRRVRNESVQDTLQDLSNYAIIGQMLQDSNWPST